MSVNPGLLTVTHWLNGSVLAGRKKNSSFLSAHMYNRNYKQMMSVYYFQIFDTFAV